MRKESVRKIAKSLTNKEGEVRSSIRNEIMAMRSMEETLHKELVSVIKKSKRGELNAQKTPKKISNTARFSLEVVKYFKSTGQAWQASINDVLNRGIKDHPKYVEKSYSDIKIYAYT